MIKDQNIKDATKAMNRFAVAIERMTETLRFFIDTVARLLKTNIDWEK